MATTSFVITARAGSDQLAGDLGKIERMFTASVSHISSSLKDVGTAAAGFAAAQVGLSSLGAAFEAVKVGVIGFNNTLDKAQASFTFLMGSADDARAHIAALSQIAQDSPFPTKEFLDASRILQGLGANAAQIPNVLKQIANAATVAQVPLASATEAIGRFLANINAGSASGSVGVGARQLQSQGLITDTLKAQIVALEAQGASAQTIIAAFLTSLGKFDGAAKEAANSWEGLIVRIQGAIGQAAGVSFQPFFRLFEELGRVFLKAINTDEAKRSMVDFGNFLFDFTETLVTNLLRLWAPFSEIFRGFIDQQRALNELIAHQAAAQEALKRGMSIKDFIFSGPADIQKFLAANPVAGPVNQNDPVERARATFKAIRDGIAADAALGTQTADAAGGALFKDLGPTQAQQDALAEARRLVAGLQLSLTSAEKAAIDLEQRFVTLAKAAGSGGAEVRRLGIEAQNLTEARAGLDTINSATEAFRQGLPVYDQEAKAIEDVRTKFETLARTGPERVREQVLSLIDPLLKAREAFKTFTQNVGIAVAQAETFGLIGENVTAVFKPMIDAMDAFHKSVVQAVIDEQALAIAAAATSATPLLASQAFGQGVESSLQSQIQLQAGFLAAFEQTRKVGLGTEDQMKSLDKTIDDVKRNIEVLTGKLSIVKAQNPFTTLAVSLDLINKQAEAFGGSFDVVGARIAATEQAINALIAAGISLDDARILGLIAALEQLRVQQKVIEATSSIIESSLSTVSNTIIDAFANGTTAAIKWGDVVTQVLKDIAKELFRVFVIQTLVSAARGALGGLGGGGGGEIQLMAGGIVTHPTRALIGEAGPEAVIPLDRLATSSSEPQPIQITVLDMRKDGGEVETRDTSTGNRRQFEIMIKDSVRRGLTSGEFDRVLGQFFGVNRQASGR